MLLAKDSPLGRAVAAHLNALPQDINTLIVIADIPAGIAVLSTVCCETHLKQGLRELIGCQSVPYPHGGN